MRKAETVTIIIPVSLDAGGEQYKPVRLEVSPGLLFVQVEVPKSEVIRKTPKQIVLTPKGAALVGETLRRVTLDAALERSGG